ncbi:MAG: tautomerase family protein [Nostoc sp.]|uniref:tautomerase family protein n=1 Tax=Nostoc sp. TaxID=1180 RepID=UPI002FF33504
MPVYTVATELGRLNRTQMEKLAYGITTIHGEETGAPEPLIHVVFTGYPQGVAWSSGRPSAPNVIQASIRAGRSQEVRVRMMERMTALMCDVTGVSARDVIVALFDFPPHWAMEAGMVLPPTEKEAEAAWDAEFYARYPTDEQTSDA